MGDFKKTAGWISLTNFFNIKDIKGIIEISYC